PTPARFETVPRSFKADFLGKNENKSRGNVLHARRGRVTLPSSQPEKNRPPTPCAADSTPTRTPRPSVARLSGLRVVTCLVTLSCSGGYRHALQRSASSRSIEARVHADRAASGHCHHRRLDWSSLARRPEDPRGRQPDALP